MKNSLNLFVAVFLLPLLMSCNNVTNEANNVQEEETAANFPEVATPVELTQGDIMCYATLIDEAGTEYNVGATFEICEQQEELINQRVRLSYSVENVNDCESNEPCGRTRQETLITDAVVLE